MSLSVLAVRVVGLGRLQASSSRFCRALDVCRHDPVLPVNVVLQLTCILNHVLACAVGAFLTPVCECVKQSVVAKEAKH